MKKRFCKRNHDKDVTGIDIRGRCTLCLKISSKKFRINHDEEIKKEKQEFYQLNKSYFQAKHALYRKTHKEELAESKHEYYLINKEAITDRVHESYNVKYNSDANFKLKSRLRHRIRTALKGNFKSGSAVKDLGCSIDFLKQYLEVQFYGGMTWDNWGSVWELDHIKELHTFDLTDREQFLEVCHYTNLQPLTIEDHKTKSAKFHK
jgi:hypothetical protein